LSAKDNGQQSRTVLVKARPPRVEGWHGLGRRSSYEGTWGCTLVTSSQSGKFVVATEFVRVEPHSCANCGITGYHTFSTVAPTYRKS
jgi:hypothetical protein